MFVLLDLAEGVIDFFRKRLGKSTAAENTLTERRRLGNKGEDRALELLKERGHELLHRNWSCEGGEIDLITLQDRTLVFTEVRTRSSTHFGTPAESVNYRKQKKIIRAANRFIAQRWREKWEPSRRFDIVSHYANGNEIVRSEVVENAFEDRAR